MDDNTKSNGPEREEYVYVSFGQIKLSQWPDGTYSMQLQINDYLRNGPSDKKGPAEFQAYGTCRVYPADLHAIKYVQQKAGVLEK